MIAFIGGGNMAEALIRGIVKKGAADIIVSEPREDRRAHLEKAYGVKTTASNAEAVKAADIAILAVKPQMMDVVLAEIAGSINDSKTIVSIAAGIRISYLKDRLGTEKLVRVMPNTPALAGEGMSVISMCECLHCPEMGRIRDIFMSVGKVMTLPEKYMDAVTALSGSGPAFISLFLEAMMEAAVKAGLSEDDAKVLAVQAAAGTARLLEEGLSTSKLREMVTSPGGTTEAGLRVFAEKRLGEAVHAAMDATINRARELGRS
jgi:pyrroline-5-carboxylate reductase